MPNPLPKALSGSKTWAKPALKIALIYTILGLIWIRFSDELLVVIVHNPDVITRLQTIKGWLYVLFTGLLLYVLVRNSLNTRQKIENALRQRNRELDLANQLSQELNSTLEFDEVVTQVSQKICRALGVTACSIWLVDDVTGDLVCHRVANPGDIILHGQRLSPDQGLVGWVTSKKQSAIVADTLVDERHYSGVDQKTGIEIRSILAVPFMVRKKAIGAIEVVHTEKDRFTPSDLVLVELLAAAAASAIENASLYSLLLEHASELEERVEERTQALTQANERLKELDRLKSKFVSDVSHELRAPITNLLLNVALLEMGKAERQKRYLEIVKDQALRLQHLVDDTLSLSRMEMAKTMASTYSAVDLNELVDQVVAAHMQKAKTRDLELLFEPCATLPPVKGNYNQLTQLVTNLINNALNYTPVGHVRVQTSLDTERNQVCLVIEDTGIGIEPEDMPHLFERFYRGNLIGQSDIPGTGLGLAIVKEIVDLHNGHIEVASEVGVGSAFRVWLPMDMAVVHSKISDES